EMELAKALETAVQQFRQALLSIPWSAEALLHMWRDRRERGLVTGKLAEPYPGSPLEDDALSEWVDRHMGKLERLLQRGPPAEAPRRTQHHQEPEVLGLLLDTSFATHVLARLREPLRLQAERLQGFERERTALRAPRRAPRSARGKAQRQAELAG